MARSGRTHNKTRDLRTQESESQPQKRATQCLNEVKAEEVEAAAAAQRGALAGGE